jgi:hypothetical protein
MSDKAMQTRTSKTSRSLNRGDGTCAMGSAVDTECRVRVLRT